MRKFGAQLGAVTPEQLRSLALTALRSWRDKPGVRTIDGHRYSVAERPSAAAREDRKPASTGGRSRYAETIQHASDAVTALMAGAREARDEVGRISSLALVPVRPLFLELARQTPSARHYIDTKQAMDQMRHRLNHEDSKVLDRWSKWVRKTEIGKSGLRSVNADANKSLMDLMHESTLRQVDPSEPFKPTFTPDDAATLARRANPRRGRRLGPRRRPTRSARPTTSALKRSGTPCQKRRRTSIERSATPIPNAPTRRRRRSSRTCAAPSTPSPSARSSAMPTSWSASPKRA
ncbi:MAG: hypothetical protein HZY79_08925 [Rhodoblastus sp.]|nr:MAG: hypothetical protein HZY79_08925 [Rhodoblastus sp.]